MRIRRVESHQGHARAAWNRVERRARASPHVDGRVPGAWRLLCSRQFIIHDTRGVAWSLCCGRATCSCCMFMARLHEGWRIARCSRSREFVLAIVERPTVSASRLSLVGPRCRPSPLLRLRAAGMTCVPRFAVGQITRLCWLLGGQERRDGCRLVGIPMPCV